jgi:hypothetical protein
MAVIFPDSSLEQWDKYKESRTVQNYFAVACELYPPGHFFHHAHADWTIAFKSDIAGCYPSRAFAREASATTR